jgi:hypothetical protein
MKKPNHKLHIFLSVITSGAWLIVYLPLHFMSKKNPDSVADIAARELEKNH